MADEKPQIVPTSSGRSEETPLTDVNPDLIAEVNSATGVDGKREKSWGGADLQPVQGEGVEDDDEGDPESVAVNQGAAPKRKKKKSKSKGQRGLVNSSAVPVGPVSVTHRYLRANLLVSKNTT